MSVPRINTIRLQRVVHDLEYHQKFESFDQLCEAVATSDWGKKFGLDSATVGQLIVQKDIITVVEKPESVPEPKTQPKTASSTETRSRTVTSTEDAPKTKTFKEGGRGRKQCPECQAFVGGRTRECVCGYDFNKPAPPKPPRKKGAASADHLSKGRTEGVYISVVAPSGDCPHRLPSTSEGDVAEWAARVRGTFMENNRILTLDGLVYFIRYFYDMSSEEHATVKKHLIDLHPSESLTW